jgi:hypothetical protein
MIRQISIRLKGMLPTFRYPDGKVAFSSGGTGASFKAAFPEGGDFHF